MIPVSFRYYHFEVLYRNDTGIILNYRNETGIILNYRNDTGIILKYRNDTSTNIISTLILQYFPVL
jgi:hypothetical protein